MPRLTSRISLTLLLVLAGALAQGCDDAKTQTAAPSAGTTPAAGADALPAGLMVEKAPADAKGVGEVREAAADGAEVVVHGRVAGSADPFTAGRAQFQLVDLAVQDCSAIEGDACPTPWDMCCADPDEVLKNSVTVQVVGADGRPLKSELKGVSGLKPLSEVSVKGKLRKSADGKAVLVDATELYVKQG